MDDHDQHVNINENYLRDEASILTRSLPLAELDASATRQVHDLATRLVQSVRAHPDRRSPLDRFLSEYDLASEEGVLLMCLAESLLRVPDPETADELIADKIKAADWEQHIGNDDLMVNASTWCLMLTGRLLPELEQDASTLSQLWREIFGRLGEPVIRRATSLAMRIISEQFVMGTSIEQAMDRAREDRRDYECFSFDMLGEAALTAEEARNYLAAYEQAITAVATHKTASQLNSVSVKLSALSPRFEVTQWQRALDEIGERLGSLAIRARELGVPLTVDAEESERLELTLAIFERVLSLPELRGWDGFGIAVQAYQKRALDVIDWLARLAQREDKSIPVRLVKGAYWDNEIKQAQIRGLADYPVFTLKRNTDVSYLAAVQALKKYRERLYPQFATHNARTVAYVTHFFKPGECEFQRLHGMGEGLYEALNESVQDAWTCRVYAPVGSYETLLPYLVRRLLENGANTSFVHRIADPSVPVEEIVADPVQLATQSGAYQRHPRIPLPADLYGTTRRNSSGINFGDRTCVLEVLAGLQEYTNREYMACPVINGEQCDQGEAHEVLNPARPDHRVGTVIYSNTDMVNTAVRAAAAAWPHWNTTPAGKRADILERAADLVEARQIQLVNLCITEAGKTIVDAHNEIRETVDFLRYYAVECRRLLGGEQVLPGPVGESNRLRFRGRGVFFCVSPWNFPMAIYTGQVSAALAAGNAVLAKPAEQSSLCAWAITEILYQAGVPKDVLHFLPGDGESIAREVLANECLSGVAFTGSVAVAKDIEKRLARKPGAIATLIAETGGVNAMLVDSSALPEQVVQDVITSAFNSAGQRCSALRVLYLQEEIADRLVEMIIGRMLELVPGDPAKFDTDIGPVIDNTSRDQLQAYIDTAKRSGKLIYQMPVPDGLQSGYFVGPAVISIDHIRDLPGEVFGPVLHVVRYASDQIGRICDQINNSGYGLTFAIHSRINHRADTISRKIRAGNVYVNRNMIGAVVGVQPFGGCGLSGTGPKAGGEHYLPRFTTEQTVSVNTAAVGGNASLLSLDENNDDSTG